MLLDPAPSSQGKQALCSREEKAVRALGSGVMDALGLGSGSAHVWNLTLLGDPVFTPGHSCLSDVKDVKLFDLWHPSYSSMGLKPREVGEND